MTASQHSGTVLLVGASAAHAEGLTTLLRGADFHVASAQHSRAGLRLLAEGMCPALVVLDLRAPGMDGMEFLLRRQDDATLARIPVIVLTERTQSEAAWIPALRADVWLTKPVNVDEFMSHVATACGTDHRRTRKEVLGETGRLWPWELRGTRQA